MTISEKFIQAKYTRQTRDQLLTLRREIGAEIAEIKAAKNDVFARFKGVHGRFQQSQLDVLDTREYKACAMFDQVTGMIAAA